MLCRSYGVSRGSLINFELRPCKNANLFDVRFIGCFLSLRFTGYVSGFQCTNEVRV